MPQYETLATLAASPADHERFGLLPTRVALWEDGARTDNRPGTYEWWYFDAHLDDGSKLVVIFMNKDLATPGRPLSPILRVNLDLPDGRSYQKVVPFPAKDWSTAADRADVRLGANRFTGDLDEYRIQATTGEVSVDVTLTGQIPPWRPATGHMLFGRWCGSRRRASTPMRSPVSRSRPSADTCTNRMTTESWCPYPRARSLPRAHGRRVDLA